MAGRSKSPLDHTSALSGQFSYVRRPSVGMEEETARMEERLALLRTHLAAEQDLKAARNRNNGRSRWRSACAERGTVTKYGRDVLEREHRPRHHHDNGSGSKGGQRYEVPFEAAQCPPPRLIRALKASAAAAAAAMPPVAPSLDSSGGAPPNPQHTTAVGSWTVADTLKWLDMLNLSRYADAFRENEISGPILLDVGVDDLDYMQITVLAHRKVILKGIEDLKQHGRSTQIVKATGPVQSTGHNTAAAPIAGSVPTSHAEPKATSVLRPVGGSDIYSGVANSTNQDERRPPPPPPPAPTAAAAATNLSGGPQSPRARAAGSNRRGSVDDKFDIVAYVLAAEEAAARSGGREETEFSATAAATIPGAVKAARNAGGDRKEGDLWHNPFAGPGWETVACHEAGGGAAEATPPRKTGLRDCRDAPLLLGGALNEAAEHDAFRQAVEDWRGAGTTGAASRSSAASSAAAAATAGGGVKNAAAAATTATGSAAGSRPASRSRGVGQAAAVLLAAQLDAERDRSARRMAEQRHQLEREFAKASAVRGIQAGRVFDSSGTDMGVDGGHGSDDEEEAGEGKCGSCSSASSSPVVRGRSRGLVLVAAADQKQHNESVWLRAAFGTEEKEETLDETSAMPPAPAPSAEQGQHAALPASSPLSPSLLPTFRVAEIESTLGWTPRSNGDDAAGEDEAAAPYVVEEGFSDDD